MTKGKGAKAGFGGLKKHLKTKLHKERSQPAGRKKLGALEKHKDYVKRSAIRKQKVQRLKKIKRAIAQRNPDEFNIKMTRLVVDPTTGKMMKRKKGTSKIEDDELAKKEKVNLLKENSKNLNFLKSQIRKDAKRVDDLMGEYIGLDAPPQNTHTLFVQSDDDDDDDIAKKKHLAALPSAAQKRFAAKKSRNKKSSGPKKNGRGRKAKQSNDSDGKDSDSDDFSDNEYRNPTTITTSNRDSAKSMQNKIQQKTLKYVLKQLDAVDIESLKYPALRPKQKVVGTHVSVVVPGGGTNTSAAVGTASSGKGVPHYKKHDLEDERQRQTALEEEEDMKEDDAEQQEEADNAEEEGEQGESGGSSDGEDPTNGRYDAALAFREIAERSKRQKKLLALVKAVEKQTTKVKKGLDTRAGAPGKYQKGVAVRSR